jgi:hypothetical protein
MNTRRDRGLREALSQAAPLPQPRPAEEFWREFRARTALTMQTAPAPDVADIGLRLTSWRWAAAAAALLVVLGGAVALLRTPAQAVRVASVPVAAAATSALSKVEEVEVFSDYSSVMIVEDIENGGTVIWVASVDTGALP